MSIIVIHVEVEVVKKAIEVCGLGRREETSGRGKWHWFWEDVIPAGVVIEREVVVGRWWLQLILHGGRRDWRRRKEKWWMEVERKVQRELKLEALKHIPAN